MPDDVVERPNPPPLPSQIPDAVLELRVKLPTERRDVLSPEDRQGLVQYRRLACYIAASMIFLRDNVLLKKPLSLEHVKPRLLGHWGTCPGIILVWSHLNLLIRNRSCEMMFVVGPGHGAPGALGALWIEGSLAKFYPDVYGQNLGGLKNLISKFSLPGGFPSHINSEYPGSIHEGGELGYALGVAFGAVMDKPDLVVACLVGDGEAETGATATAWHAIKYLDPQESGAVIPILHVNGFKISERTIFGCMDDKEMISLFTGYGYQVCIVEDLENIDEILAGALDWALDEIKEIQRRARTGDPVSKPRWPMIVLRTPKGWTGPKEVDGKIIEGSFHSHQVPLPKANKDETHLQKLDEWLSSYNVSELLGEDGSPIASISRILPKSNNLRLGQIPLSNQPSVDVTIPDWTEFAVKDVGSSASCMEQTGKFLDRTLQANPHSVRIFSPDELESNKLGAVLEHTGRNFQWDEYSRQRGGRVIEVLSEHMCQAFMQGYTLTGRVGIFPSYESFLGIVHTMMVQYAKFRKMAGLVSWRGDLASINYIESSTWARQEHNGFSHQNPSFIGAVLNLKPAAARVYLPPDANCFLSTVHHCLESKNYVNLMIGSKQPTAVYFTPDEAVEHCRTGAGVIKMQQQQHTSSQDPDVVLCGIGAEVTFEAVKAAELLGQVVPSLGVRVVNVTDLMVLSNPADDDATARHPHAMDRAAFDALFTADKPVLFNYHGYATELKGLLFGRGGGTADRVMSVEGYREEGSTTTPFDMMLANHVSRFHLAARAVHAAAAVLDDAARSAALGKIWGQTDEIRKYIVEKGEDPGDIYEPPKLRQKQCD